MAPSGVFSKGHALDRPWVDRASLAYLPHPRAQVLALSLHSAVHQRDDCFGHTLATAVSYTEVAEETLDECYRLVTWSLNAASAGAHPAADVNGTHFPADSPRGKLAGKAIAGGHTFQFGAFEADWKYAFELFKWPGIRTNT